MRSRWLLALAISTSACGTAADNQPETAAEIALEEGARKTSRDPAVNPDAAAMAEFAAKEVAPNVATWEADGIVPREVFAKAGAVGLLGFAADERFGGVGARDFRYNQILIEAFMDADCGAVGLSFAVHNDICLPYLADLTAPEQQDRWLPGFVSGDLIGKIEKAERRPNLDLAAQCDAVLSTGGALVRLVAALEPGERESRHGGRRQQGSLHPREGDPAAGALQDHDGRGGPDVQLGGREVGRSG